MPDFNKSRKIAYCDGPVTPGVPETVKFSTRWAAWVSDQGIRVGKYEDGTVTLPANTLGERSSLYFTEKPEHLSISWTKDALFAIAIEKDSDTIEMKLYTSAPPEPENGTHATFSWQGRSPLLFNNWLLYWDITDGNKYDLVCYYLSLALPNVIMARFQRENFAVEHVIHEDLPVNIDYLISTDVFEFTKQVMYLKTTDDANATLYSDDYGLVADESESLAIEFLDGDYVQTAFPATVTSEEEIEASIEITGLFKAKVAKLDTLTESKATVGIEFVQGTYE